MELTSEHEELKRSALRFVEDEINPYVDEWEENEIFPAHELFKKLGNKGFLGVTKPEKYGGAGLDQIAYGIIMQELERCDSGLRSTSSVQSSLVMYPIWKFGSEEQSKKYLPKLASGETKKKLINAKISNKSAGLIISNFFLWIKR